MYCGAFVDGLITLLNPVPQILNPKHRHCGAFVDGLITMLNPVPQLLNPKHRHCGAFVDDLISLLPKDVASLIDRSVYSRNRCFRYASSV